MLSYDDPAFTQSDDLRTRTVVDVFSRNVYGEELATTLAAAGLNPGDYPLTRATLAWTQAVPDAAQLGKLGDLVKEASRHRPAFARTLEDRLAALLQPPPEGGAWYRHDDPYGYQFVGLRNARAVIDRVGLRAGLRALADEEYWVLVVHGQPRSGKSHTWLLVDHLRTAGMLVGNHRFARVTTHSWSGDVTGDAVAQALAAKLGLSLELTPSGELDDARVRKFLDRLVGVYPAGDGIIRWIVLDGLDRPGVQEGARDLARGLVKLVEDGELPQTRLIVTGLDPIGLHVGYAVRTEEIPLIDRTLLTAFLADIAAHLGHEVTPEQLEKRVGEILGPGPQRRDLGEVEDAVVRMVTTEWVRRANGRD